MANFARFDQDLNVSLESKFFPKIEKSQTVENENRQHELSIAIVKMDIFFFLFDQALMNTYQLAHEFYEAQLHSDNGIPNQSATTEEKDTDARIVSRTDTGAILLDEKMQFSCKNKKCCRSFDPDVIIDHRLTMRENGKLKLTSVILYQLIDARTMQVKGKNSRTASGTYSRLSLKTHLYLSTISGTRHLKTWNNTTKWMELSPEFTVTKEVELQRLLVSTTLKMSSNS